MNTEMLRTYCLSKVATEEALPFDDNTLVFKVGGKMFALHSLKSGDRVNLKCDPDRALELRAEWEEIQPGYHMNKKHWNTVSFTGRLNRELIEELIDHSYDLVVKSLKKKDRELLGL